MMDEHQETFGFKQIIVIRKDLNMRKGKLAAQAAHASMKVLLDLMIVEEVTSEDLPKGISIVVRTLPSPSDSPVNQWLSGQFTKICVSVDSEEELEKIYNAAKEAGMPCSLIVDNGVTEFNNVKTKTCCAIGPWDNSEIDKITGNLKLL